jgi:hypothetical protein
MPKPLRAILAAITNDIEAASISADVARQYWQCVYDSNELLRDSTVSRLRITEVRVSLPMALADIEEASQQDRGLQPVQIAALLPERLPRPERELTATRIYERLHTESRGQNKWLNENLIGLFEKIATDQVFQISRDELNLDLLRKYRRDFLEHPAEDRAAQFLYRASELEQVNPNHIVRMDLVIELD